VTQHNSSRIMEVKQRPTCDDEMRHPLLVGEGGQKEDEFFSPEKNRAYIPCVKSNYLRLDNSLMTVLRSKIVLFTRASNSRNNRPAECQPWILEQRASVPWCSRL
jgi:hypothetical protein